MSKGSNKNETDYPRDRSPRKKGNLEDGTQAAHILAYEVFKAILFHKLGPRYGELMWNSLQWVLNQEMNLRIKSTQGNSEDHKHDMAIIKAIHDPNIRLTNLKAVNRLVHAWEIVQKSEFPENIKVLARECFSSIHDKDGHVIIRSNSKLCI